MIASLGICRAKPGQEDELGRRMKELVAPTSKEEGCLSYDLYHSQTDKAIWIFWERWQSERQLDGHVGTPHFRAFLAKKDEVLAKPPDNYRLALALASRDVEGK